MDRKDKPADTLTKFCSSGEWYERLKPQIFSQARGEASVSHLSTDGSVTFPVSSLDSIST